MDNFYLQELIAETKNRKDGLILSYEGQPAIVVLSVEKYNELVSPKTTLPNTQVGELGYKFELATEKKTVLVTGGAGYIGSHVVYELLKQNFEVIILDNLSTGKKENVAQEAKFVEGDLGDLNLLRDIFASTKIDFVMHFAASIEVEESVNNPEKYFINNVKNTSNLLLVMSEFGVKKIIFSSTAAVYGNIDSSSILENSPLAPNNPYGFSKLLAEKEIKYFCQFAGFSAIIFRYFNACGCDPRLSILPTHESHILPKIFEVVNQRSQVFVVNGNDYPTLDGSCVRDYIHVLDIAQAHILALNHFGSDDGFKVYNIGTGKGNSVLEVVSAVAGTLNKIIPMEIGKRRPGDAAITVANAERLKKDMGFFPKHSSLENIVKTSFTQFS